MVYYVNKSLLIYCLLALSCTTLLGVTFALFEDQVGKDDWTRQHIGLITYAQFDVKPRSKIAYVASSQGVVASLSLSSSGPRINWRRVLPEGLEVIGFAKSHRDIVVLSPDRFHVFDFDGNLNHLEYFNSPPSVVPSVATHQGSIYVSVLHVNELRRYCSDDWKIVQKVTVVESAHDRVLLISSSGIQSYALISKDSTLHIGSTQYKGLKSLQWSDADFVNGLAAFTTSHFAIMSTAASIPNPHQDSSSSKKPYVLSFFSLPGIKEEVAPPQNVYMDVLAPIRHVFGKYIQISDEIYDNTGPVFKLNASDAVFNHHCVAMDNCLLAVVDPSTADSTAVNIYSTPSFKLKTKKHLITKHSKYDRSSPSSPISRLFFALKSTPNSAESQWLIQSEDWRLAAFVDTKHDSSDAHPVRSTWKNDEALAQIVLGTMVDLPVSTQEQLFDPELGPLERFAARSRNQLELLKGFLLDWYNHAIHFDPFKLGTLISNFQFKEAYEYLMKAMFGLGFGEEHQVVMARDHFGFGKVIVLVTASGKIFGFHSLSSQPIWAVTLPHNFEAKLLSTLTPSSTGRPELLIIADTVPSDGSSYAMVLDPLNGSISALRPCNDQETAKKCATSFNERSKLDFKASNVLSHASRSSGVTHPAKIFLLDTNKTLWSIISRIPQEIEEVQPIDHFYVADADSSQLIGYRLAQNTTSSGQIIDQLPLEEIWRIDLSNQQILGVSHVVSHTISPGKIVGTEKSVLPKYINHHSFVVASTIKSIANQQVTTEPAIQVAIVDSLTGHIVHRLISRASSPSSQLSHDEATPAQNDFHMTFTDNWLVFTYWSTKSHRYELSSVQLFIDAPLTEVFTSDVHADDPHDISSSVSNVPKNSNIPSTKLLVLQQTFILSSGLRTMAVTKSHQGVSNQDLLVVYHNGNTQTIPEKLLDPRRPIEGQPIATEGAQPSSNLNVPHADPTLRPYDPWIPMDPFTILNYNQTISRAKTVLTQPAALESTSVICVIGLDTFCRLFAQRGTWIFRRLSQRNEFNSKWI